MLLAPVQGFQPPAKYGKKIKILNLMSPHVQVIVMSTVMLSERGQCVSLPSLSHAQWMSCSAL